MVSDGTDFKREKKKRKTGQTFKNKPYKHKNKVNQILQLNVRFGACCCFAAWFSVLPY